MKTIKNLKFYNLMSLLLAASLSFTSCNDDDDSNDTPPEENDVEIITDITLVFTNTDDATDVVRASAEDPDDEGAQELVIKDPITLSTNSTYELTFEIFNNLDPEDPENIGDEILEEDNEHQIFFGFTNDVFADPLDDGNIDNASDTVNYEDEDENGNNLGLVTLWTTEATASSDGEFRIRLQHQPEIKTATTGAEDGDTDFDLTFVLNVVQPDTAETAL